MDTRIAKPPPALLQSVDSDAWTAPFWASARRRELVLPRCGACGRFRMPPTPFCPYCRDQSIDWSSQVTAGTLYSYTVVDRAILPATESSLPYVPAVVEFADADGVRLITNIVGSRICDIVVDRAVLLDWIELVPGLTLPIFCMAGQ